MRKIIYQGIIERIKGADCGVQHISLWNENITRLDEYGYNLPAVFVEFGNIKWEQCGIGSKSGTTTVRLHIMLATPPPNGSRYQSYPLELFDTIDTIINALSDLASDNFNNFQHIETITDHNHGLIQHNIETFACEIKDFRAINKKRGRKR